MSEHKTKILIAVDDTDESTDAVSVAYDLFGAAPDYLITSIGRIPATLYPMAPGGGRPIYVALGEMADSLTASAEAIADEAAEHLEVDATIEVDVGPVGASICQIAKDSGASVIVIGSHDRTIWARLFLPSVGKYVVDNAPCPVLVVR
ncbi:MAG: nucleotide-binding universal stress UspA family protein [Candidatus Aldehydirespiratoraceae bacterium]|jgi:nucleotide-binding universal stress UspA family protein